MQCDMCGTETRLFKANIEGTELNVCKNCSGYGKIIRPIKTYQEVKAEKKREEKQVRKELEREEIVQIIAPNFAKLIRTGREKQGLKQEDFAKKINEKESLIHSIETGKITPSIALARKFEKVLKIKLVEEYTETHESTGKNKADEMTIGDLITIKK